jgi:hypothetical protein
VSYIGKCILVLELKKQEFNAEGAEIAEIAEKSGEKKGKKRDNLGGKPFGSTFSLLSSQVLLCALCENSASSALNSCFIIKRITLV